MIILLLIFGIPFLILGIKKGNKIVLGLSAILLGIAGYLAIPSFGHSAINSDNEFTFYGATATFSILILVGLLVYISLTVAEKFPNFKWLLRIGSAIVIVAGLYVLVEETSWNTQEELAEQKTEEVAKAHAETIETETRNRQDNHIAEFAYAYKVLRNSGLYGRPKVDSAYHVLKNAGVNIRQVSFVLKPGQWATNPEAIPDMYDARNSFVDKDGNYPSVTYFGYRANNCGDYDCAYASRVQDPTKTKSKGKPIFKKAPYYFYQNIDDETAVFFLYVWEDTSVPPKIKELAGMNYQRKISFSVIIN